MSLRRRLVPALAALAAAAVAVPLVAAPAAAAPKEPVYYLALGDSLAYGYQRDLIDADRADDGRIDATHYRGYHDLVAPSLTGLVGRGAPVETVNLSCPGETVLRYEAVPMVFPARNGLFGQCQFALGAGEEDLHDPYTGSQGAAALAWLAQNGDQTGLVSISLGSNDLIAVLERCELQRLLDPDADFAGCIDLGVRAMLQGLVQFLGAIRQHTDAPIVVFNYYNSFEYAQPDTELLAPSVNTALEQAIAAAARVGITGVTIADARAVINEATKNQQSFHALVDMANEDIHPTDAGYAALARALRTAVKR